MELTKKQLETLRRISVQFANFVNELDEGAIEVHEDIAKEVARKLDDRICLACGAKVPEGEKIRRGLDGACYGTTTTRIRKGIYSERELIQQGKIAAEKKPGGRPAKMDQAAEMLEVYAKSVADAATKAAKKGKPLKKMPKRGE